MNPERWQRLKDLFEAAYDKSPAERAVFLDNSCRGNPSLKKEVEDLLASYSRGSFLEKPAHEAVPELFDAQASKTLTSGPSGLHFDNKASKTLTGSQLGPYAVGSEIGRGGMGLVYLAHDMRLDRPVAIKMLAPQYTRDAQQRERLKREARAAARLSNPSIATVYALEEFDDRVCIVSEYIQGLTLGQIMSQGRLPFDQVLDIAIQIARGLVAAHEEGIVHRDLKPENVIRTESGIAKILDFGLARVEPKEGAAVNPSLTQSGVFLGTPAYASPEQLLGSGVDRNTDIFSFGIILYEMASGQHPFKAADSISVIARILEGDVPDISQKNPSMPGDFARIILRCLKKKPSERYASTRDLLTEMENLLSGPVAQSAVLSTKPFWWWQFHQACVGFGYYAMLYPLWRVKQWLGGLEGSLLFFPALIAVGIAANLRLHLWFTSRYYVSELAEQRRSVAPWMRWADCLFIFMLVVCAVRVHTLHAIIATLLMAVAMGALVGFWLIEPVAARAALDKQ